MDVISVNIKIVSRVISKKHILVVHERERYGCGEYDSTFG